VAIQTLSDFWTNTLQPALQTFWGWVQTTVFPIVQQLIDWLAENLPVAIQTLSDFWTETLQPALATFWDWVQTTVFPIIEQLITWLGENLPVAIQTLSDFWTNTLRPAIEGVWSWLNTTVFPFWESFANLLSAVVGLAIEVLAGLWENILLPVLTTVYDFVKDKLQPVWQALSDFFGSIFGPALNSFRTGAWAQFQTALDTVNGVIETVKDTFDKLADAIRNFKLPDWLVRHSPSPFEMVFIGANDAIEKLNTQFGDMAGNLKLNMPSLAGLAPQPVAASAPVRPATQAAPPINILQGANLSIRDETDIHKLAHQIAEELKRGR
jgi:phage-related protein